MQPTSLRQAVLLFANLCILFLLPQPALSQDSLQFSSPSPWQVVQRDKANNGVLVISGMAPEAGKTLETNVWNDENKPVAQTKSDILGKREFLVALAVPAGGWYVLTAAVKDAAQHIVATGQISPVGVGEVFIAAGQSNSYNCCGESPQKATSNLVSGGFLTEGAGRARTLHWSETIDGGPLAPAASPVGGGGGPWPAFASRLAERVHVPVAVIQIGCGETTSQDWLPGEPMQPSPDLAKITYKPEMGLWAYTGTVYPDCGADTKTPGGLYIRLVTTAKILSGFRAVLWDQGESDMFNIMFTRYFANWQVPQQPGDYYAHLSTIISRLNQDTGKRVPWLVAQASYMGGWEIDPATCLPNGKPWQYQQVMAPIIADQQALVTKGLALPGPSTDVLVGSNPQTAGKTYRYAGPIGRCSHFSNAGLTALGQAWEDAVWHSHLLPASH